MPLKMCTLTRYTGATIRYKQVFEGEGGLAADAMASHTVGIETCPPSSHKGQVRKARCRKLKTEHSNRVIVLPDSTAD